MKTTISQWYKGNMALTKKQALYLCLMIIVMDAVLVPLFFIGAKYYFIDWLINALRQMLRV